MFFEKKLAKNLEGIEKVCTFASAFAQNLSVGTKRKEFFERFT
jgi:hypothetical protein